MDAHESQAEKLRNDRRIEFRLFVHPPHMRLDALFRKCAARALKELFVVRQDCKWSAHENRVLYTTVGMEHHGHPHSQPYGRNARGSLKRALIITVVFLVAEFAGALYTNSL